jgi:crotonobetaine/carnitine-CoA ligase
VLTHPGVAECAAIGVPDPLGEEEVMIFIVATADTELAPADLSAYLAERMSRFMLPRYIQLVPEIPRTPTARIRKVELRKLVDLEAAWDRASGAARG